MSEWQPCRYVGKRFYATREDAVIGAERIKFGVERKGEHYDPLFPHRCGDHWHLTSCEQGVVRCPWCSEDQDVWVSKKTGNWVIAEHGHCPSQEVARAPCDQQSG